MGLDTHTRTHTRAHTHTRTHTRTRTRTHTHTHTHTHRHTQTHTRTHTHTHTHTHKLRHRPALHRLTSFRIQTHAHTQRPTQMFRRTRTRRGPRRCSDARARRRDTAVWKHARTRTHTQTHGRTRVQYTRSHGLLKSMLKAGLFTVTSHFTPDEEELYDHTVQREGELGHYTVKHTFSWNKNIFSNDSNICIHNIHWPHIRPVTRFVYCIYFFVLFHSNLETPYRTKDTKMYQ